MKRDLKRIEATLNQLSHQSSAVTIGATRNVEGTVSRTPHSSATVSAHSVSFEVQAKSSRSAVVTPAPKPVSEAHVSSPKQEEPPSKLPLHTPTDFKESLTLPKFKMPSFTSHRNTTNPALASSLLKEMLATTEGWQVELATVLSDIQALYEEGPIVDGWLESHAHKPDSNPAVLRHAEPNRLMDYVEEICATPKAEIPSQLPHPGYLLCGLNADGQVWSTPCPPEQVPSVSLAIARHQKLRQLLSRKQALENRLNQLSETLVVMHSQLNDEH